MRRIRRGYEDCRWMMRINYKREVDMEDGRMACIFELYLVWIV